MELSIKYIPVGEIKPYENNPRKNEAAVPYVVESIKEFGFKNPVILSRDNVIIAGHTRLKAAEELGIKEVPCIYAEDLSDEQIKAFRLADNKVAEIAEWDFGKLEDELADIDIDMSEFGFDDIKHDSTETTEDRSKILEKRFLVPPFSILDARQGYWQERKKAWRERIGDNGEARNDVRPITFSENFTDASLLDPVLSEVVCRWFAPNKNAKCFDVFAGDTVFGYVSSYLGHTFTGIELRKEQADFNNAQCDNLDAKYICDDGRNVLHHIESESQDLFFSCPPYFDLEVYSDMDEDASNQETYEDFYNILETAFANGIKCLKDNRFAVIVCGDVRNKKTGRYYGFPEDIKRTFTSNGMILYNELILIDPVGTAAFRAGRYMDSRKVAKVHQNVLVFYKGNTKQIKDIFPKIEVDYESENLE